MMAVHDMARRLQAVLMLASITFFVWACFGPSMAARQMTHASANGQGKIMSTHAKGTFEVKMTPVSEDKAEGSIISRMTNEKVFHGDLEATSKGEMLTAGTAVKGSAGYVLIERVTGVLQGRTGTFILQHNATLTRGAPQQEIVVVPDSGTGQLTGLAGNMTIIIKDSKHFYDFDYTLPATQ
jgi:Protein of unknown function (DUF3224)